MRRRISISSDLSDFHLVGSFLDAATSPASRWVDQERLLRLRLAVHELLVNIATHAYAGGDGEISLQIAADSSRVVVTVTDQGAPMEGTVYRPLPETPSTNGYGLPVINAAVDHFSHRHSEGQNCWLLELLRPEESTN